MVKRDIVRKERWCFCFVFWCAEYWIFFEEWKGVALNTNLLPCKALNKIVDKGKKKPKEPLHY